MRAFDQRTFRGDSRPGNKSHAREPRPVVPVPETAREQRVSALPDECQTLYWLIAFDGDGLTCLVAIVPASMPPAYRVVEDSY